MSDIKNNYLNEYVMKFQRKHKGRTTKDLFEMQAKANSCITEDYITDSEYSDSEEEDFIPLRPAGDYDEQEQGEEEREPETIPVIFKHGEYKLIKPKPNQKSSALKTYTICI